MQIEFPSDVMLETLEQNYSINSCIKLKKTYKKENYYKFATRTPFDHI